MSSIGAQVRLIDRDAHWAAIRRSPGRAAIRSGVGAIDLRRPAGRVRNRDGSRRVRSRIVIVSGRSNIDRVDETRSRTRRPSGLGRIGAQMRSGRGDRRAGQWGTARRAAGGIAVRTRRCTVFNR